MSYLKTTEWTLDPNVKGIPEDESLMNRDQYQYNNAAIFSIDGEVYKSQKITGQVVPQCFPLFI
jgi:hypothetical protein